MGTYPLLSNIQLTEVIMSQHQMYTNSDMRKSNNNREMALVPHQRGCTSDYISYLGNLYSIRTL